MNCEYCKEEHAEGSVEARECTQEQFDFWVANPGKWAFTATEDQIKLVKEAYYRAAKEFGFTPDISFIRKLIVQSFVITGEDEEHFVDADKMLGFWKEFSSDMPEVLRQGNKDEIEAQWSNKKIQKILLDAGLGYMQWEYREAVADLRSPMLLRKAANILEQAESDGFGLYNFEEKDGKVFWSMRKGKEVNNG
jgi:hypothetical protein